MKAVVGLILVLLFASLLAPGPEAGAPPSDVIPWDSCVVIDTLAEGVIDPHWVYFITRDKYEHDVLGWDYRRDVRNVQRDVRKVKRLIQAKKVKDP